MGANTYQHAVQSLLQAPASVIEDLQKLDELITRYPRLIPAEAAAQFLGMDKDAFKKVLSSGHCPFGVAKPMQGGRNGIYKIPSTQFWLWYRLSMCVSGL
ncbi:hypothetical protein [Neobittarella massiliensis]|uniref:Uncharacterized protein n=1 Tax=Neobittarella massiliensis (ex Bilen et al. 2018) TaxID=2041842 RepID=A0A8J6IHH4_9FIRM|nr:hypothetical protein [Neobittarella massiliensis]MBC3517190.1 hypothetical protein [Neobittarella massiliensis]